MLFLRKLEKWSETNSKITYAMEQTLGGAYRKQNSPPDDV